ncbi:cytochrome c3 family protein [Bacillus marasmi]|uniref:cytochrome c3 family protein n=1 Tax=Bacillus marasmi TaxID=1926279 RepID=UPI0011C8F44E|nr:NapC/NirT family cytochrome c [Bacillus marasmi]
MAFWRKKKNPEGNPAEKKPGAIKRLIGKIKETDWKNPVNRWKLLFASLFVFIAMLGTVYGAIEATSTPSFCKACHEMGPEHITFEASAHSEISCVQCHVNPGMVNTMVHKVYALKEVYYHIVGPPDPIAQTDAVENVNCVQCHSENRLVTATGDLKVNHKEHIDEGIPCITCHSGVAHAKVVERGLNTQENLDKWTPEVAEKLMGKEYMAPNMGTCIDCHNQVNQGKKPWEDIAYSLPESNHGKKEEHKAEAAEVKESHKKTQDIILQAVGKQANDEVKLSMECKTCHTEIDTPKTHQTADWNQNHGSNAVEEFDKCINCHTDSKWIKVFAKQDINELLNGTGKEKYTKNINVVKTDSRKNQFCSACHAERPTSHGDSDAWLTQHAGKAQTNQDKENCLVCHDRTKVNEGEVTDAPTDVYCEFCHRTGFKGEK